MGTHLLKFLRGYRRLVESEMKSVDTAELGRRSGGQVEIGEVAADCAHSAPLFCLRIIASGGKLKY